MHDDPKNIDLVDRPFHILVVEDSPADIMLFKHACRPFGNLKITVAGSVRDAVKLVSGDKFAVAFVDLNLHDSMGASSIRDIKKVVPEMPVVAMTGMASPLTRQECKDAGASGFILKSELSAQKFIQYLASIGFGFAVD